MHRGQPTFRLIMGGLDDSTFFGELKNDLAGRADDINTDWASTDFIEKKIHLHQYQNRDSWLYFSFASLLSQRRQYFPELLN